MNLFQNFVFLADAAENSINDWVIAGIGFFVVFIALVLIYAVCAIFGIISKGSKEKESKEEAAPASQAPVSAANADPFAGNPDRQKIIAAICAAIAEDADTDIKHIRITSIKKI